MSVRDVPILIEGKPGQKRRQHHYHHHHHHRVRKEDVYAGSNACVWVLLFVVIAVVAFWIVAAFVPWDVHDHHHVHDVDKKRSHYRIPHGIARKRSVSTECAPVGELWDADLGMCAPKHNSPLAFEPSIMDTTKPVCSSFFASMCGKWNAQHTNEDRSFSYAYHRNARIVEKIITEAPRESPIAQFYQSCMGLGYPAAAKESELEFRHITESIVGDLKVYADLPTVFGRLARLGYGGPLVLSIERHPLQKRMVPFLSWDDTYRNFTLPRITAIYQETRYLTQYSSLFMMDRISRTAKVVEALNARQPSQIDMDYERYLNDGRFANDTSTAWQNISQWHTPYKDSAGWNAYLQALDGSGLRFAANQTVWLFGSAYLRWFLEEAIPGFDLLHWKSFVEFAIMYHSHQFLPALPHNVYFRQWDVQGPLVKSRRFYHRILRSNESTVAPSPKQCFSVVQHMMPGLVAAAFVQRNRDTLAAAKQDVRKMMTEILDRYAQLVRGATWLRSADAKEIALKKLSFLKVRVAEPDEWEPEPFALRVSADRYDHNMNLVRRYRVHRNLQEWHKDRPNEISAIALFGMPLTEINAFYSPSSNTITILAGILSKPFYDASYDELSKYAMLSSILSHELGHVFDAHGIRYDHEGRYLANTIFGDDVVTRSGFFNATRCIVSEYNVSSTLGCNETYLHDAYGNATLNEDMADMVGIKLAYHAYFDAHPEASLGQKQHFFMVFAQMWCASWTAEHQCHSILHDVHAIPEFRVDVTLRNTPEFAHAFSCSASTQMHRPEVCAVF